MRNGTQRERRPQRYGASTVALLLLSSAFIMLACSGGAGDLVEATPTATSATTTVMTVTPTAVPPKPTSTPKPKPPTATPVPFRVISAAVSVSPSHYTGGCDNVTITFTFTFKLLANGPGGTISFYTSNPDGPPSGTMTAKAKAGQTTVTATQQVDYDQTSIFADESPWVQVHTSKPNSVSSAQAHYAFTCIS